MTLRDRWLWVGVVLGPAAWFLDLVVSYAVSPGPHRAGPRALLLPTSGAALLLAAAGAAIGWRNLAATARASRARFLAEAGIVLGALAMLLVVALALPTLVLVPGGEP